MSQPKPVHDLSRTEIAHDSLAFGQQVVLQQAQTLIEVSERLGPSFTQAVAWLADCRGSVLVTGVGKAGRVGQKLADTFCSTGTLSHYLHPVDAVHGDLGRVRDGDVIVALSKSGETAELVSLLPAFHERGTRVIALTSSRTSSLGRGSNLVIELGKIDEACPLGVAPSSSTTAMLAVGDALALSASRLRGFARADFARLHPGGSLGRHLRKVEEFMRPIHECRVAEETQTVRAVLIQQGRRGRRVGAVMLRGTSGELTGFLTDSDVARLLESGRDEALDRPAVEVMTRRPFTITVGAWMSEAIELMQQRQLSELPVIDAQGTPVGLIDRADLDCWIPEAADSDSDRDSNGVSVSELAAETSADSAGRPDRKASTPAQRLPAASVETAKSAGAPQPATSPAISIFKPSTTQDA